MPNRDAEMDTQLLRLLGEIDANVKTLMKNASDTETRIRSLEQFKWRVVGAAGVCGLFGSFVGILVSKVIK